MKRLFYSLLILFIFLSCQTNINTSKSDDKKTNNSSPENFDYLNGILKDTFSSIFYFRHPVTGLQSKYPYDPQKSKNLHELVKVETITQMLASIAIAGKIGLISNETATTELNKMITSIETIHKVYGFPTDLVRAWDAGQEKEVGYPVGDMGFFPCGIIIAGEAYPEFKSRTDALINSMDWSKLYDSSSGFLYGGYVVKLNSTFETYGTWRIIGADRLSLFIAIASKKIPNIWNTMPRNYFTHYGISYLRPGEDMNYAEIPFGLGCFLDERGTDIGMSSANMAWAQMHYALDMDYPTWGWSNCMDPNATDYMGFGDPNTNWSVINPHAVAEAVVYYPNQVAKSLHIMESMGIRQPITVNGTNYNFGLRASLNIDTKQTPNDVLAGLDQTLIFLSLANYLYDGIVWKLFKNNDLVKDGISLIPEYSHTNNSYLDIYKERDKNGPTIMNSSPPTNNSITVDDFTLTSSINTLGFSRETNNANATYDGTQVNIEFTSMDTSDENIGFKENLGSIDLTCYKALRLQIKGDYPGNTMIYLRISNNGGYKPIHITTDWQEITIPLRNFLGGLKGYNYNLDIPPIEWNAMWADRTSAEKLWFGPIEVSRIQIKNISFLYMTKDEINNAGGIISKPASTYIEPDGTFERMETTNGWTISTDKSATLASIVSDSSGYRGNCLKLDNTFDSSGGWISIGKSYDIILNANYTIKFWLKANVSSPENLEVKIIDSTGATYLKVIVNAITTSAWHEVQVLSTDITYGWGGTIGTSPDKICKMQFGVTSSSTNEGQVYFDDLKILQ